MKRRIALSLIGLLSTWLCMGQLTLLDPTFGTGGYAEVPSSGTGGDRCEDVVLQSDGRIVMAATRGGVDGPMLAIRMLENGEMDGSFSGNGIAPAGIGQYGRGYSVLVQPDGRILLGGSGFFANSFMDLALARFTENGALDTTFSDDGRLTIEASNSQDALLSLAMDVNGDIFASGKFDSPGPDIVVMKLHPDGGFDTGFGSGGMFTTDLHTGELAEDMVLRADGRIALPGAWRLLFPDADMSILQLLADGTPDPSFGTDGLFRPLEPATNTVAVSALELGDGRILFAGKRYWPGIEGQDQFLGRITANGEWDATYGSGGRSFLSVGAPYIGNIQDVVLLGSGKALVTCDVQDTSANIASIMVMRVMPDGVPDASFGLNGRVIMPCPTGECQVKALAVLPDDRVIAAGSYGPVDGSEILVMRWLAEASPVGIDGAGEQVGFQVYPNPCRDELQVVLEQGITDVRGIDLVDPLGKTVATLAGATADRYRFTLPSALADGPYVVKMRTSAGTAARRVVVQR